MHPVGPMNENDSTLRVSKQSVYWCIRTGVSLQWKTRANGAVEVPPAPTQHVRHIVTIGCQKACHVYRVIVMTKYDVVSVW